MPWSRFSFVFAAPFSLTIFEAALTSVERCVFKGTTECELSLHSSAVQEQRSIAVALGSSKTAEAVVDS